MRRVFAAGLGLIWAMLPSQSWAVFETCEITATSLPFGVYDPAFASALDATGTVTVTCSAIQPGSTLSWIITMSPGGAATFTPRRLSAGPATLSYNIFTTAARTAIWGDGSPGTSVVSDSRSLNVGDTSFEYTMYGRIPALQDAQAGAYTDAIIVTVTY